MSAFRQALAITGVALRRLARDRVGLFFTFALPMLIIILLGAAIPRGDIDVGVVMTRPTDVARELDSRLRADRDLSVRHFGSAEAMRTAVRRDEIDGGLLVGADDVTLILDPTSGNATLVRSRLQTVIGATSAIVQAREVTAGVLGASVSDPKVPVLVDAAASRVAPITVTVTSGTTSGFRNVSTAAYASVGELVLFIFLISLTGGADIVDERRLGIVRRATAAPARALTIVVGEGLGRYVIALVQAAVIIVFTRLLFGISWGNPFGVAGIVAAFALVSTAAGLLVGAIARSPEQASSFGPVAGIALGMLGGCMWPLEIVPKTVQTLGHATPHAWAIEALVDLMGGSGGFTRTMERVLVLLAFAAVLLPLGAWRLRRSIGA